MSDEMIKITMDGQETEVPNRSTIVEAAKKLGIHIPTLCHHEALSTWGACRVCLVEIGWPGYHKTKMVTACNFPIDEPCTIQTNSERVVRTRRIIVELLMASSPNVKAIKDLARDLGIEKSRFPSDEDNYCILCGLCIRTCEEQIGCSAIAFVGRGIDNKVETPIEVEADACIGCGACAFVCPTGVIYVNDDMKEGVRRIQQWHGEYKMAACKSCGKYFTTEKHIEYLKKKINLPGYIFENCPDCKKKFYVETTAAVGHM